MGSCSLPLNLKSTKCLVIPQLETSYSQSKSHLAEETLMRVDLENRCQSLVEELEFRKSLYDGVRRTNRRKNTVSLVWFPIRSTAWQWGLLYVALHSYIRVFSSSDLSFGSCVLCVLWRCCQPLGCKWPIFNVDGRGDIKFQFLEGLLTDL